MILTERERNLIKKLLGYVYVNSTGDGEARAECAYCSQGDFIFNPDEGSFDDDAGDILIQHWLTHHATEVDDEVTPEEVQEAMASIARTAQPAKVEPLTAYLVETNGGSIWIAATVEAAKRGVEEENPDYFGKPVQWQRERVADRWVGHYNEGPHDIATIMITGMEVQQ